MPVPWDDLLLRIIICSSPSLLCLQNLLLALVRIPNPILTIAPSPTLAGDQSPYTAPERLLHRCSMLWFTAPFVPSAEDRKLSEAGLLAPSA
jgi:hypothetical protein